MTSVETNWWEPFYDDLLVALLLEQTSEEEIEATLDFLEDKLELEPGARVFDQCCGIGRLSVPLALRGYSLVAVDQAEAYVRHARGLVAERGVEAELEVGDAFTFVARPSCDAAFNWWTSFGYAVDDHTNQKMIRRAFESLRPGARFALDFINAPSVLRHFQPAVVDRRDTPDGQIVLIRESRLDLERGTLLKQWTYLLPDGRRVVRDSTVRMYMPCDLGRLFTECGFEEIEFYGGVDASPLTEDASRCIVVARRPR